MALDVRGPGAGLADRFLDGLGGSLGLPLVLDRAEEEEIREGRDLPQVEHHDVRGLLGERRLSGQAQLVRDVRRGVFARVLGQYAREEKVITLEDAVRRMTSAPAQRLKIKDRGLLREGFWADITLFDPDTVEDKATFREPKQYPVGIPYVIVNGEVVLDNGVHTGKMPGRVLRR